MSTSTDSPSRPKRQPLSKRRRVLFNGVYAAYIVALVCVGAWFYRGNRLGEFSPTNDGNADVWQTFYPELRRSGALDAQLSRDDGFIDVLLLGGSVLEDASELFESSLREKVGDRLRLFDLAKSAHTTRDTFHKYSQLQHQHFDLIVIYHGINDVRMNCCPDAEFRDDYTHCHWYRSIKRRSEAGNVTLARLIDDEFEFSIPLGKPEPEMLKFGDTIKTAGPFRRNLEHVVASARAKQVPVVMMTFAYYIPADYSLEKFDARQLDYGPGHHQLPAELWGTPGNVARTIDRHNEAIEAISREYENVIAIDQRKQMPANGTHFSDPCHLTEVGNRRFVENMLPPIVERLRRAGRLP